MPFQAWILDYVTKLVTGEVTLQWGHALSGMDTEAVEVHLDEIKMLQWGHAFSGMDILDRRHFYQDKKCFNGAMPFQAWIHGTQADVLYSGGDASMGPCPFMHGYTLRRSGPRTRAGGFNGAMPFQAWI